MNRAEFITDALKNPGKVYQVNDLYYVCEGNEKEMMFSCGDHPVEKQSTHGTYLETGSFPAGDYQPVEPPEPDFVEQLVKHWLTRGLDPEEWVTKTAQLIESLVDGKVANLQEQIDELKKRPSGPGYADLMLTPFGPNPDIRDRLNIKGPS